jgi:AcrR family transcriptional regulator
MNDDPRLRLLNAAGEVFAHKGFDAATVREICQTAGVNVAAVNYYFRDKRQLYFETVTQAQCMQVDLSQFTWPPEMPAEHKLAGFVRLMMTEMLDDERPSWHVALMMREMAEPTEACAELVRSFIGPKFAILVQVLRELLPTETTEDVIHLHAFSVVGQCLLYRFHRPVGRLLIGEEAFERFRDVELIAGHITQFSLQGLRGAAEGKTQEAES